MSKMFQNRDKGRNQFLSQNGAYMVNLEGKFFIWHQYYTRRWDAFDSGEKSIATAQTNNWSKDLGNSGDRPIIEKDEQMIEDLGGYSLSEIDLGTQRIRTSWVKMGLQTQADQINFDF